MVSVVTAQDSYSISTRHSDDETKNYQQTVLLLPHSTHPTQHHTDLYRRTWTVGQHGEYLGAFQLVLTYLYGRGPIAVDMWLNLVTTNGDEVGELLSQLLPAIGSVGNIYVPLTCRS